MSYQPFPQSSSNTFTILLVLCCCLLLIGLSVAYYMLIYKPKQLLEKVKGIWLTSPNKYMIIYKYNDKFYVSDGIISVEVEASGNELQFKNTSKKAVVENDNNIRVYDMLYIKIDDIGPPIQSGSWKSNLDEPASRFTSTNNGITLVDSNNNFMISGKQYVYLKLQSNHYKGAFNGKTITTPEFTLTYIGA